MSTAVLTPLARTTCNRTVLPSEVVRTASASLVRKVSFDKVSRWIRASSGSSAARRTKLRPGAPAAASCRFASEIRDRTLLAASLSADGALFSTLLSEKILSPKIPEGTQKAVRANIGSSRNTMGVMEKSAFLMGNRAYSCSDSVRIKDTGEQRFLDAGL